MVLIEDSRQQQWDGDKHSNIHRYCSRAGIEIMRTALPYGDYCLIDPETGEPDLSISVDTKQGMLEIMGNIMNSRDHVRFKAECVKAQEAGSQLVILIEEIPPLGMVELWQSPLNRQGKPFTRANPVLFAKCIKTMTERYGVRFVFCDKRQTGRVLIDILTGKFRIT